ncbi:hypothetical protein [Acetobacter sp. DsW_063]|nr:hypothetical protein [Acetobacter sp. DsW_063]
MSMYHKCTNVNVLRQNWTGINGASPNGEALDALVAEMRASAA